MREDESGIVTRKSSKNVFVRLLRLWAGNRRAIMVTLIAAALAAFWITVADETRRSLGRGLLAQQEVVALLLVFSLLTLSLLWSVGQRIDAWFFMLLNLRGYHPLWLDRFMWGLTQIGNGIVGILISIFLYFINLRQLAAGLLLGILSLWLVVEIIKALVDRRRPFIVLEGTRVVGWREPGLSFPSGHTAQTFFMATIFAQYFQVGALLTGFLYGISVMVALTRIYVGAHYPRDVIGGAILGSVWGTLSLLFQGYLSTGSF